MTAHLKGLKCFFFFEEDALDNSDSDQVSSTENDNETVVEEMKQHVAAQDSVSDGAHKALNTPVDVLLDAKTLLQKHRDLQKQDVPSPRHNHLPATLGISTGSCNCWSDGRWNTIFHRCVP